MIESTTGRYLMLLPEEQRARARHALETSQPWEWIPRHPNDEVEIEAIEFPRWSAQHQSWRMVWLVRGYAVEDGQLVESVYQFDQDYRVSGQIERVAACPVESEGFAAHTRRYAALAYQREWAQYLTRVAQNGEDPLRILYFLPTKAAVRQHARRAARRCRAAWEEWRQKVGLA